MGPFWAQLQCVDCLAFRERWVGEGASLFGFYRETNACCEEMLEAGSRKGTGSRLFVKSRRGWNNSNFIKTASICQSKTGPRSRLVLVILAVFLQLLWQRSRKLKGFFS